MIKIEDIASGNRFKLKNGGERGKALLSWVPSKGGGAYTLIDLSNGFIIFQASRNTSVQQYLNICGWKRIGKWRKFFS